MLEMLAYTVFFLVVCPALLLGIGKAVFAFTTWGPKARTAPAGRLNWLSKKK